MPPMQLLDSDNRKISSSTEWWDRRTNLERRLVLGAAALVILNLAFIITIAVLANQSTSSNDACKSDNSAADALQLQHTPGSRKSSKSTTHLPPIKHTGTSTQTYETSSIPKCIPDDTSLPVTSTPLQVINIPTTLKNIWDITSSRPLTIFPDTTEGKPLTIFPNITKKEEEVCTTAGCATAACSISSNLNVKMDPCENFYEYACGGWILRNVMPNTTNSIMTAVSLTLKFILSKDILNQPVAENEHVYKANVLNFYKGCMNLPAINNVSVVPLRNYINIYSVWTYGSLWNPANFYWLDAIAKIDFDILLWVEINPDPNNSLKNMIYLQPGALGPFWTPQEYYQSFIENMQHASAYINFMVDIASALDANFSTLGIDMKNVAFFEAKLANITLTADGKHIRDDPVLTRTTIGKLLTDVPGIDWLKYIKTVFPPDVEINENEEIIVNHIEYFSALIAIINETLYDKPKVLPNYILVRIAMTYAFDLSFEFQEAYAQFMMDTFNIDATKTRWNYCLDLTVKEFPNSIGTMYIQKYFPTSATKVSKDIFTNITTQYKNILKNSWLDTSTEREAEEKINSLISRAIIAYLPKTLDEIFLNDQHREIARMDSETHFQNRINLRHNDRDVYLRSVRLLHFNNIAKGGATENTPVYNVEENMLTVYAAALQPPRFDKDYPKSFNYAGIGSEMAYLITLALNENGRVYDGSGSKNLWGTNKSYETFNEKTECFVDQYDKYLIEELNQNVNGTQTKESNVAETAGLKVAFKAFKALIAENDDLPLPGLQNFTSEKLFFINFAQMYCGSSNLYNKKKELIYDKSPDIYRVNGVVSNLPEFATAFNCPDNSPMNPSKKCSVWE